MSLRSRIAALLGVAAYPEAPARSSGLADAAIDKLRAMFGGQISPLSVSQTEWFLADLDVAIHAADSGDLSSAGRLWRAMQKDGVLKGVLRTVTQGIAALPKKFSGDEEYARVLQGRDGVRSVFDAMCPPTELMMMAADGVGMGVALGELVPVAGRDYPVLVRRNPENLRYVWTENRWYFLSAFGPIAITPGDGRWVLHIQGGREAPWQAGLWPALGSTWIRKTHAQLHKANWEAKLANPARAAISPSAASQAERQSMLDRVIAWGVNTAFELPPGWDVKIIESNGNGHESFDETVDRCDREYAIAIAGQVMTTDGGEGFSNGEVGENQLEKQVQAVCEAVAYTINTQVIPQWVVTRWGEDALDRAPVMTWDATPPKDEKASSEALGAFGTALVQSNAGLQQYGKRVDAVEYATQYGIPLVDIEPAAAVSVEETVDEDDADDLLLEEPSNDDEDDEEPMAVVVDLLAYRRAG